MSDARMDPLPAAVRRLFAVVARLEPLFILAMSPFFIFPRLSWAPWLLAALALLWLVRWSARGRLTARTPLDGPMLVLVAMMGVSLWTTFDLPTSFPKLAGLVLGIALFYALANALRTERAMWLTAGLLLLGGTAIAAVSLIGTQWAGRKVPLLVPALTTLYERLPLLLTGVPRAERGFSPNQVGGALALFIPLAAALLLHQLRCLPQRPEFRHRLPWALATSGLFGGLVFAFFVLVLTQSRGSYVATALALLLVVASQGRWPRRVAIIALVIGIALIVYFGVAETGEALFGIGSLESLSENTSWAGRVEIWKRSLRVIQDHPLTGIGFDTLFPVIHARYPTFLLAPGSDATHAHNIFLQVALNLGLPGLAAFLWLLIAWGRMLWQVRRDAGSPASRAMATGLACGLLGQLVFGLTDAMDLGAKPGVFMWAYLGLGGALWLRLCRDREPTGQPAAIRPYRPAVRLLALLVAVLAMGWGCSQFARMRTWRSLIEADLGHWQALARDGGQAIAPWRPEELLHLTRADLQGMRAELTLPLSLAPRLCWLPRYGADLQTLPVLLQIALDLTAVGEEVLGALDPLLGTLDRGPEGGEGIMELAVATLKQAQPQLAATQAALERVRQDRRTICTARLSPQMSRWVAHLDQMLLSLENGVRGAMALPELLGALGPRTYLVLIQNDDELRPTGGFISGVARVVLDKGRVVELAFEDSYAVDDLSHPYPEPPRPLREIMGAEMWVFRDANWSPDFPTSAQVALGLYRFYDARPVDGVIALDQQALRLLVAALEPLKVVEYPEPVRRDNVIQALRQSWIPSEEGFTEEWWQHRKDFIGRLVTAMVNRLQNEPGQVNSVDLGWAVLRALEEKHLFVYLPHAGKASQMLRQAGWDGALRAVPGDYLMVVDANLGFNKVGPFITESISYTVDLREPAQPRATLTLVHRHTGQDPGVPCRHQTRYDLTYEQMMQRCYWDYVRVYVPQGSRPLEATSHPVPASMLLTRQAREGQAQLIPNETGKTVFSSFLVLSPGQRTETRFVYDLPPGILEQDGERTRYRLHIQKQGGTGANEVRVALLLPEGARDIGVCPTPHRRDGDTLLYELQLESDLEIEYRFSAVSHK